MYINVNNNINNEYSFVIFLKYNERIGKIEKIKVDSSGFLINLVQIKNRLKKKLHSSDNSVIINIVAIFQDFKHK